MHIVGVALALLGVAAVWYWRFKLLREAGSEVADLVGRARGRFRRGRFRQQAEESALAGIEDPALAASVFLFALAKENADTRHLCDRIIGEQVARIVPAEKLDEVISYAKWAARDVADSRDVVRRFKRLWCEKLTREEREDLIGMAKTVLAAGDGVPEHNQKLSLATLRNALRQDQPK